MFFNKNIGNSIQKLYLLFTYFFQELKCKFNFIRIWHIAIELLKPIEYVLHILHLQVDVKCYGKRWSFLVAFLASPFYLDTSPQKYLQHSWHNNQKNILKKVVFYCLSDKKSMPKQTRKTLSAKCSKPPSNVFLTLPLNPDHQPILETNTC